MTTFATGPKGFMQWLKVSQPKVYAYVMKKITVQPAMNGFGRIGLLDDSDMTGDSGSASTAIQSQATSPASTSWTDTLKNLVTTGMQVYQGKQEIDYYSQLNDANLKRAQLGLAPLNAGAYQGGPSLSLGINAETQKVLLYGGLGLVAVLLFKKFL